MSEDDAPEQTAPPEPVAPAAPAQPVEPVGAAPVHPFAPVAREPWVNPGKRTPLVLAAVLVALLLCAGSFVIGVAVGHHRGGGQRFGTQLPRGAFHGPADGRLGQMGRMGPAGRLGPMGRLGPGRLPSMRSFAPPPAAPTPTSIPAPRPTHS